MNYQGKIVIVTGAANGIGKVISLAFLKLGAIVVGLDIDANNGKNLFLGYKKAGLKADFYKIDLTNVKKTKVVFEKILAKYQRVDILINNAGKTNFKPLLELTIEEWDEVINVNLRASFILAQEFIRHYQKETYGRIINISSTRFLMSEEHSEAYAASKGGIVALTHALAISVRAKNFTVNAISPGWIEHQNYSALTTADHAQHPAQRVGKPEDIVSLCLFLADEKNDFITGENIVIDGGMTKKMIYS